jgi:hypothetical protein
MSGLEAVGIAASIIQVADLGTKLSVQLFSFYHRVKNANDTVQLLSNEVALVSAILRELGDNLKEEESLKLCSDEAFRTLRLVLNQCWDVLGQIQKVVDTNDGSDKSRFQLVTGRFRIVLLEPKLDQLKVNLERLKSTMLLLLNVFLYAGQIRRYTCLSVCRVHDKLLTILISNNVPTLVQEQRELTQSLLTDRSIDHQKPQQSDKAPRSPRGFSTGTTPNKSSYTTTGGNFHQKDSANTHQRQPSQGSTKYANSRGAQTRARRARQGRGSTELKDYNILIQNMLDEVESCRNTLEENRHARIKNGVLNIHSGEIMRFRIEHGPSIQIDHSLFAYVCFISFLLAVYWFPLTFIVSKNPTRPASQKLPALLLPSQIQTTHHNRQDCLETTISTRTNRTSQKQTNPSTAGKTTPPFAVAISLATVTQKYKE